MIKKRRDEVSVYRLKPAFREHLGPPWDWLPSTLAARTSLS